MVLIHEYQVGGNDVRQYGTKKGSATPVQHVHANVRAFVALSSMQLLGHEAFKVKKEEKKKHSSLSPPGEVLQILAR